MAVTLGVAGLGVAVAQALLFSAPPTWFQIAVVAFWGVVGGAYLVSGLVQQRRDRARPDRHRVPDGELSTGGPGEDADVGRRDDVTPRGHTPWRAPAPARDDDSTAVVPRLPAVPVRPARPRGLPAPAMAAGRPAAPALTPAGTGGTPGSGYPTLLPGRPAPVATGPAAGAAPPPSALETTAARLAPWPHAAVAATSAPTPAPVAAPPAAAPRASVPSVAGPRSAAPLVAAPVVPAPAAPAAAEVTDVHPAVTASPRSVSYPATAAPVAAPPASVAVPAAPVKPVRPAAPAAPAVPAAAPERPVAPSSPEPTSRPVTSPSFALRFAQPAEPDGPHGVADTPRNTRTSGRHAVPRARVADEDEIAPRRHRHRRPVATAEQPAVSTGAPTPARRHRTSAHRRAG